MSASHSPASEDLLALAAALRRFPGVDVERAAGREDDEGWWHLMLTIDHDDPEAWATVAALASIVNAAPVGEGGGVFKPVALSVENGGPGETPFWSITQLYGTYSPADALAAVNGYLDRHAGPAADGES